MFSRTIFSRTINSFIQSRSCASTGKFDGVVYEKVVYYPRRPGDKDPPITPTKLLQVQRVKPYKGNPYWHKKILDHLKLNMQLSDIAVVKNTPEMCARLWKIKHLVRITAINLPNELPEGDSKATVLHENGDLLLAPRIDPERERLTIEFLEDPKRLGSDTLSGELRMRWLNPYDL